MTSAVPSFAVHAMQTLETLRDAMEALAALDDADVDLIDGVLTVEFANGSQLVLNRQEAAAQIWLSSVLGPAHFGYDAATGRWLDDRNGRELRETLAEALTRSTGRSVCADDLA